MDYKKAVEKVNTIKSIVKYGVVEIEKGIQVKTFGEGEAALHIIGMDDVSIYEDVINYLWKCDNEIFDTLTQKDMEVKIISLIRETQDSELNEAIIKNVYIELKSKLVQEFEVIYQLHNIEYKRENPLKLGPFTIYNLDIHGELISKKYPHSKGELNTKLDKILRDETEKMLISVVIRARNYERADEKGKTKLKQFEDIIGFIIPGKHKLRDIGVFKITNNKIANGIIASQEGFGDVLDQSYVIRTSLENIFIDDSRLGNDRIWSLFAKSYPNDMERRIISAIEWIGKALRDEEPTRAFTQYMFALEALLQYQQKGQFVSPSIAYQMSEFVAFIINNNLDDRLNTEKIIRDLYAKRSAIVHGGSTRVYEKDIVNAEFILQSIIRVLLLNDEFKGINTIQELGEWVKKQKYK